MFRRMRLKKQQLSQEECIEIMETRTSGVLSVAGDNGYPYGVPLSYAYCDGKIYFHGAGAGHKLDAIRACDKACFTVIAHDEVVSAEYTTYFKAVIAFGRIRVLEEPEDKRAGLKKLGMKYCSDVEEGMAEEIESKLMAVSVMEMTVEHMTGKQASELLPENQ